MMIRITANLFIATEDLEFSYIASPGPGGQNVNKVASGVQLRFNIFNPALNDAVRSRLREIAGKKLTKHGELILKATRFRTQIRNKEDVIDRFVNLIRRAAVPMKKRRNTIVPIQSKQARLRQKKLKGRKKDLRTKISED